MITYLARVAGALSDRARGQDQTASRGDIIIAAKAQPYGSTVLSRNVGKGGKNKRAIGLIYRHESTHLPERDSGGRLRSTGGARKGYGAKRVHSISGPDEGCEALRLQKLYPAKSWADLRGRIGSMDVLRV
jgi:hypothetical protein